MKLFASFFLLFPVLAHAATGSELLGKWVHVKYSSMRVEISENRPGYVLTELKDDRAQKYIAKLADGMLVINAGPCAVNVDIEKKTGNLIYGGKEYRRLKAGESFEYIRPAIPRF